MAWWICKGKSIYKWMTWWIYKGKSIYKWMKWWICKGKSIYKWMMTGDSPILRNPQYIIQHPGLSPSIPVAHVSAFFFGVL